MAIALVAAAALWAMAAYNRLVQLRNRIANAFGQIDVQLKRRHDLVPNLVEVARGLFAAQSSHLAGCGCRAWPGAGRCQCRTRAAPTDARALGALAVTEGALGGSLGRLVVLAEAYPELKADATMQSLGEELTSTENRLGFARQAFNDQALEFNSEAMQFPALIVARLLGFAPALMLEATRSETERAVPQVQF